MDMVIDSLQLRQQKFENWVRTVRDPALESSEGRRRFEAKNQRAIAEYEIGSPVRLRHENHTTGTQPSIPRLLVLSYADFEPE